MYLYVFIMAATFIINLFLANVFYTLYKYFGSAAKKTHKCWVNIEKIFHPILFGFVAKKVFKNC